MHSIPAEMNGRVPMSRMCENALLIGIMIKTESRQEAGAHVDELARLVRSLGIKTAVSLVINLREPHPRWLLGKGKVDEIARSLHADHIDLVVFDVDLSPAQQRNLEKEWNTAVIDRREVILDIFADRALTREAVLQVALARMQYSLPRLTRAWTHLSRQRGGSRGNRGKGETQLETDRRLVLDKIAQLKRKLIKLKEQREVRRRKRMDKPIPSVSLVGYTNAGKSSLLNAICGSDVYVRNKLFATLDPTTRRMKMIGGREILLTDTVGFIRKLPHDLIDAFRSTLEEATLADVILHVVDAGSPELDQHIKVTESVLEELGAENTQHLLVFNKTDTLNPEDINRLKMCYRTGLMVSAHTGSGLQELLMKLSETLDRARPMVVLRIPQSRWDMRSKLHQDSTVLSEEYGENEIRITARLSPDDCSRLSEFIASTERDRNDGEVL